MTLTAYVSLYPMLHLPHFYQTPANDKGCLPRTTANPAGQPKVLVGWGFGAPKLTLYGYRALESIMHVYPGARVRVITVGESVVFF